MGRHGASLLALHNVSVVDSRKVEAKPNTQKCRHFVQLVMSILPKAWIRHKQVVHYPVSSYGFILLILPRLRMPWLCLSA